MLSKNEFLAKNKARFDARSLPKAEREARWKAYQKSCQPRTNPAPRSTPRLSLGDQCLVDYAKLVRNPFVGHGGCLPAFPARPSQKVTLFTRGLQFSTGTNGIGYAVAAPGTAVTSDLASLAVTTAAYTGTMGSIIYSSGANIVGYAMPSPYISTQFGTLDKLSVRLVAAGLRARYVGSKMEQQGTLLLGRHPNLSSFVGMTGTEILTFSETKSVPCTRAWSDVVWFPTSRASMDFVQAVTGAFDDHNMIILAQAGDAGITYEVEFYCHFEIIGEVSHNDSPSYSSPKVNGFLDYLSNVGPSISYQQISSALYEVGLNAAGALAGMAALRNNQRRILPEYISEL